MNARDIAVARGGKRSGKGWLMQCPVPKHDDKNPSCLISDGDRNPLVTCLAGCDRRDIIAALKAEGNWPDPLPANDPTKQHREIVATYDYTDEDGELRYQIVRFQPKAFLQRRPDGRGGWEWKKDPRQILYRMREVREAPIVFLVEGEKDVETLRSHGFVATTAAGGAKATWLPEFTAALAGREVIIIPDNDGPGWKRAATVARALLGHAARIRVLDLPRDVKDIADWFAAGHSEAELIAMLEGVHAV